MGILNPTPDAWLVDAQGRPYFLWDLDLTLDEFRRALADPDPTVRGWMAGKLLRQAKPDDVFRFLTVRQIRELWPHAERHLGRSREFWDWLLREWERDAA